MVDVKPLDEIKENFRSAAALVPERYKKGVRRAKWKDKAVEGQSLYEQQMQDTNVLKRREAGINKISDEQWRRDAETKGGAVIGTRIQGSVDKQAAGFAPYREVLQNVDLPARTADPATNVTNRVIPIATAMRKKKDELRG